MVPAFPGLPRAARPAGALTSAVLIAAAVALAGAACARREAPPAEVVRPIRTVTVGDPSHWRERTFSGRSRAEVGTLLSFRVGGEISALPARIGLSVRAGDVIATLDARDYDLQVKQLEAQLAQAEAQLKQASADYNRTKSLYEASSASRSDLDKDRARFESTRAQCDSLQQSLDLARQQLAYCTLRAPMDGVISSVPVDVHTTVNAGQPVAGLNAGGALQIDVGMPEALISQVHLQDQARVAFDALPGASFDAIVTQVGIQTSDDAATYPVRLTLQAGDARLRAGMACSVSFARSFELPQAYVTVPPAAVVGDPSGERYVWVYDEGAGTVRRRVVEVGALGSGGLQILAGLAAGEVVVIRGANLLQEGMKVRPLPES